jgi:cell wall-associated NlpC family hydrolase
MKNWRLICSILVGFGIITLGFPKVVLGKLGQSIKRTGIYASPTSRSRLYYQARSYEYLVLRSSSTKGWYRVLLQNGRFGYIKAQTVACLPYEVTAKEQPRVQNTMTASTVSSDAGAFVANYGLNYIGTPYKWGGNDINRGIDCSGFVKKLYGVIGKNLPRTAAEQAKVGTPIYRLEDLRPGDRLYFYSASRKKIGHTGIYLGQGNFVHSSSTHKGVATDVLMKPKWLKILCAARR